MLKKQYETPQMVDLGSVLELTRGTGSSDKWDIGTGYKDGCEGSGDDGGLLEPC